ncbi:MAG TPA: VOC family protein [Actinomycetales bacterium]|nr:VOC family protein [Actinomycetales bacterium]
MDLSLSHCFVTVHDPDLALAFYRDVLGLDVRNDVSAEGFRWVTLSPPSQPEIEIVLVEPHAGHSAGDGDALLGLLTKGSLNGVIFRTEDLESTFEKVRAGGAEVLQEPIDQPYGVRDCAFRDPSGNMIRIMQASAA